MTENNIKFFVRILPGKKNKTDVSNIILSEKGIKLVVPEPKGKNQYETFQTDGIFTDHCQSEIFREVVDETAFEENIIFPLKTANFYVPALSGYLIFSFQNQISSINAMSYSPTVITVSRGTSLVVIALGEPDSGKTYTMLGIKDSYQFRGIIPRFLKKVFSHPRASTYKITISFIEFLNNMCTDLLSGKVHKAEFYKAIKPIEVKEQAEAFDLLFKGEKNRSRRRGMSCGSAVYSIFIHIPATVIKRSSVAQVHLLDAAGMWNASRTETCIAPLKNLYTWKWPFTLRKAVFDNIDKQDAAFKLVPMIGFIRTAISNGRLRLIAHVKDDAQSHRYNKWTLAFCYALCGRSKYASAEETQSPYIMRTKDLHNEVQELRDHRDQGLTTEGIVFIPYRAEDALNDYSEVIKSFFDDEKTENELMAVAHPTILLQAMKKYYRTAFREPTADASTNKSKKSMKFQGSDYQRSLSVPTRKSAPFVMRPEKEHKQVTRETSSNPQENWTMFWAEFLDRHPAKRRELSVAIRELQQARIEKGFQQEALNGVKQLANESEKDAKRTLWKRSLKGGEDAARAKTREAQLEEEKDIVLSGKRFDDQLWQVRNDFALAHKNYVKKLQIFNNVSSEMDALFMEYILTTYDSALALPVNINYEERLPTNWKEPEFVPNECDENESTYEKLKQRYLFKKTYEPPSEYKHLMKYTRTKGTNKLQLI